MKTTKTTSAKYKKEKLVGTSAAKTVKPTPSFRKTKKLKAAKAPKTIRTRNAARAPIRSPKPSPIPGKTSRPSWSFQSASKKSSVKIPLKQAEQAVCAVRQPDGVSCGWATTKWLLNSFGVLDVTDRQLRNELNTDAERGVRAWWNRRIATFVSRKFGKDWEAGEGTLPMAIFSALRKRGIVLKNPVRLERFSNYTDYLYDTFREGGRAAILLWRMDGLLHWMGVDRQKGVIRIMDPARGRYIPFQRGLEYWESGGKKPNFLVFGFVQKAAKQRSGANELKSTKTDPVNMDAQSQSEALVQWVVEKLAPSEIKPRRVIRRPSKQMKAAAAQRTDSTRRTRNKSIRSNLAFVFNRFAAYDLIRLCRETLYDCRLGSFDLNLASLKTEQMEAEARLQDIATSSNPNERLRDYLRGFSSPILFNRGIAVVGIDIRSRRSSAYKEQPSFFGSLLGKLSKKHKSQTDSLNARPVRDFAWVGLYRSKNHTLMVMDPVRARPCELLAWLKENDFGFDRVNTDQTRPSNGLVLIGVGRPKRKGKAKH